MIDQAGLREAQALYDAGEFRRCREAVVQRLGERPDDAALLRLAGRCSLELGLDDAAPLLRRAAQQAPADASVWQDLGTALISDGKTGEAVDALREVIRLRPDDVAALVDLGHAVYALGDRDAAIAYLTDAAQHQPPALAALRSLTEIRRRAGEYRQALDAAVQIVQQSPDDALGSLDVAELSFSLGLLDASEAAYARLRTADGEAGHDMYAYHGMIQVEMRRERWRRALDLAIDATNVDRNDLTTQILAFVVTQVFGAGDRPAPNRGDLEMALAVEQAEHRRLHTEALVS